MTRKPQASNEEAPAMGVAEASNVDQTTTKGDAMNSSIQTESAQLPVIAGHAIPMDGHGRFNLNAIHHAAGAIAHKRPSQWARRDEAKELIAELSQSADLHFGPIHAVRGGAHRGTYAHELLAVSYAGWISPKFQLQVNQVFLDYRLGKMQIAEQQQALPNPLTPDHQRGIQKAVARKAQSLPKNVQRLAYSRLYSHLKDRFEVGTYKDIDDSRYTEALGAVQAYELEGELMAPEPEEKGDQLTEQEISDLYLLLSHVHWVVHYWNHYRMESALRALGSPAAPHMGEHMKVAAIYSRRLAKAKADLMRVSRERLGLDALSLPGIA